MISFTSPWILLLLLPLVLVAWRMLRRARTQGVVFASASNRFARLRPTWRQRLARNLPFLFLGGLFALIVAAAGPRTQLAREVRSADALAVMMTVDVSETMLETDLTRGTTPQTRLDVVKEVFHDFVQQRPDDLIGLVTFGGYASVRSPLTADHQALLHTLSGVEVPVQGTIDAQGRLSTADEVMTAIGDGLAVALLRLKDAEPTTKIAILLSDGMQNAGVVTMKEAANAAKELGIRVYTIGVGQNARYFDEEGLKSIAKTTGADYAHVRSTEQLEAFLQHLSELETTRVERQIYTRYRSHAFPWLVGGTLACCLAAIGLMALLRRPL